MLLSSVPRIRTLNGASVLLFRSCSSTPSSSNQESPLLLVKPDTIFALKTPRLQTFRFIESATHLQAVFSTSVALSSVFIVDQGLALTLPSWLLSLSVLFAVRRLLHRMVTKVQADTDKQTATIQFAMGKDIILSDDLFVPLIKGDVDFRNSLTAMRLPKGLDSSRTIIFLDRSGDRFRYREMIQYADSAFQNILKRREL